MSLVNLSLVYISTLLDIVMVSLEPFYKFTKSLVQYSSELSGDDHVSAVLRCYLSVITPYQPGHVIVRGCDRSVDFSVVHSPLVGKVERGCPVGLVSAMILLRINVPYD